MLQGHIEIGQHLRIFSHDFDKFISDIARISVEYPQPGHIGDGGTQLVEQGCQAVSHAEIMAVVGGVLGDQVDLVDTHFLQRARVGQNRFYGTADGGSLDERNGAKSARTAAAIGYFQVGAAPLHIDTLRSGIVAAYIGHIGQVIEWFRVCPAAQLAHNCENIHPATRAKDAINAGNLFHNLLAVALGQASGGDQDLTGFFFSG